MWQYSGQRRPDFALEPGPGQESVWDYPRPPVLVVCESIVEVASGLVRLAYSSNTLRVLETASPPTFYLPAGDLDWTKMVQSGQRSYCEWKGEATYWALASEPEVGPIAWSYENPSERFAAINAHVSFYPSRVECLVDGERVLAQPGEFYGGWVTSRIVGPFKGEPGTGHW